MEFKTWIIYNIELLVAVTTRLNTPYRTLFILIKNSFKWSDWNALEWSMSISTHWTLVLLPNAIRLLRFTEERTFINNKQFNPKRFIAFDPFSLLLFLVFVLCFKCNNMILLLPYSHAHSMRRYLEAETKARMHAVSLVTKESEHWEKMSNRL